jgi:small subunit ribosomal protein S8
MSDPIADMLTRLRNAAKTGRATVDIPASTVKQSICAVLKHEGFIRDYALTDEVAKPHAQLRVTLKYGPDSAPVIQGIRRVSRPSLRVHSSARAVKPVRSGLGITIVSTSQGVMTAKQARAAKVGGEIICEVW